MKSSYRSVFDCTLYLCLLHKIDKESLSGIASDRGTLWDGMCGNGEGATVV